MGRAKAFGVIALILLLGLWFGLEFLVDRRDAGFNPVVDPGPYSVSADALKVHEQSFVVDLHADPLLWSRDLLERGRTAQVDLPRLQEGGMGLQVFGVVTKSPKGQNFDRNAGDTDRLTTLFLARRTPPQVWFSLYERARYQARQLERAAERSKGGLLLIRSQEDLDDLLRRRAAGEPVVGALLGLEGAHALEGKFENLQGLFDLGLRMLGTAHFFDNEVSGSAHGLEQGGLSELGRRVVEESERLGIVIDLAHASRKTQHEVIQRSRRPVVVSHTGVKGTCEGPRNLSDQELRAVAETGGVVGIGFFPGAVCGRNLEAILDAIDHAVRVMGDDHVALGSDFDGAVQVPFHVGGMPMVTAGLLERGYSTASIQKILGGNAVRVLRQTLPTGT